MVKKNLFRSTFTWYYLFSVFRKTKWWKNCEFWWISLSANFGDSFYTLYNCTYLFLRRAKHVPHSSTNSLFTDPLFSLQSPSSARDKKQPQGGEGGGGVIDRQHKGVGVGKKKIDIFLYRAPRSLADVFRRNEKKNRTTSGYRLWPKQRNKGW